MIRKLLHYRKQTERQEDMNTIRQLRIMMTEADTSRLYKDITEEEYERIKHDIMRRVIMLEEKYGIGKDQAR